MAEIDWPKEELAETKIGARGPARAEDYHPATGG